MSLTGQDGAHTTIGALLRGAEEHPAREAVVDGAVRVTYGELEELVLLAAGSLQASNVRRGSRVAVWAPNGWQWIVAALAAHACGAVLVPLNTRFKDREAEALLRKSRATHVFTTRSFLGADRVASLDAMRARLPDITTVVACDEDAAWTRFLHGGSAPLGEIRALALEVDPDDVADILFTSGTTGEPKGAVCTHLQAVRAYTAWTGTAQIRSTDRLLVPNPFFHAFGYKAGWLSSLLRGATVVPLAVFDADIALELVERERISVLAAPPTVYWSMRRAASWGRQDLSSLRVAVTGASVVPIDLVRSLREEFGFAIVLTAYGLTECSAIATMCDPSDSDELVSTTSGRAIDGVEVKVVDDGGDDLPPGEPGEVLVRGFNVMEGYLDAPNETASTIDSEGWLRTGDIGRLSPAGYLTITDRKKDMFIVGGFNVYPAEVEQQLREHPAVADAAVVGGPDERMGEIGVAFVVADDVEFSQQQLIDWCRERMANFKVPRSVVVIQELPRNAAGKVDKRLLRDSLIQHEAS
jgi:acyl-CoA synthetase (AMP-forming)/AMP-acid ligase II